MYQTVDIKHKYFLDTNKLISLNDLFKIFSFYFLMVLAYLFIILFNGPDYVDYQNYYWYMGIINAWIAIFSPIIFAVPILYSSYALGKEPRLLFFTKCLISTIRLIFLYSLEVILFLPILIIFYMISPVPHNLLFVVNIRVLIDILILIVIFEYLVIASILYTIFSRNKTQNSHIETKTETLNAQTAKIQLLNEWRFIGKFYYFSMLLLLVLLFLGFLFYPTYFNLFNPISYISSIQYFSISIQILILMYIAFPLAYSIYYYRAYQRSKKNLMLRTFLVYIFSGVLLWSLYIILNQIYAYDLSVIPNTLLLWLCVGIVFLGVIYRSKAMYIYKHYFNITNTFFYYKTLQALSGAESAEFYAKQFIVLQAEAIKEMLPKATPKNLKTLFRVVLMTDILRLQKIYEFNSIPAKSIKAVLEYAMKVSSPLIANLELALQQHLTEQLLSKRRDPVTVQADINVLWPVVNKVLLQWESVTDKFYLPNN